MSTRRGRPPLPVERRKHVRITIAVTDQVADAMFIYARRKRKPSISEALSDLLERLARREQELQPMVDFRIQTP